jgi:hypothetical protein
MDIQQMMGRLLGRQNEEDAKEDARLEGILAFVEGLQYCRKGTTAGQVASQDCPEKSKVGLEGTEAALVLLKRIRTKERPRT